MCRTVCIIDDDEDLREVLARVVRSIGLTSELFDSAESFLQRRDKSVIGCMLLDVQLSGINGVALLERLGEGELDFPVFLISGEHDAGVAAWAKRAGVVIIDKPFDVRQLAQKVRSAASATGR